MKIYKATILVILSVITISLFTSTATAITGNSQPDSTPYTGIVVLFGDAARQIPIGYSTGFLLSPTVMVTAGHSLIGAAAVSVCFDQGPISYAIQDGKIVYYGAEKIYNGMPVNYPGYVPSLSGNQELATSDIGIIVLDQPVKNVKVFPTLPNVGFSNALPVNTVLQVVGYGFQQQTTPKNGGAINSWSGTLSRNTAQVLLLPGNFEGSDKYLKLSANDAQGKGGVSFGDSGGPVIYKTSDGQDVVLAVNAFVSSVNCGGVSYHTRLDVPEVLAWITSNL